MTELGAEHTVVIVGGGQAGGETAAEQCDLKRREMRQRKELVERPVKIAMQAVVAALAVAHGGRQRRRFQAHQPAVTHPTREIDILHQGLVGIAAEGGVEIAGDGQPLIAVGQAQNPATPRHQTLDAACAGRVVVDEEEYRLMKAVSDSKKAYKASFAELREAKCESFCSLGFPQCASQ